MKKIILTALCIFALCNFAYGDTAETHTTYATNSEVNATNLNGNLNNLRTIINGKLDNTNAKTSSGFRFYEVLGSTPSAGTEGRAVYNTATDSFAIDDGTTFNALVRTKIGYFTREMDAASGSASITGVGFQPDLVMFVGTVGTTSNEGNQCWGADNATLAMVQYQFVTSAGGGGNVNTTNSIWLADGDATNYQVGKISAMGTDGFTIAWTKANAPGAGTAYVIYLAYNY